MDHKRLLTLGSVGVGAGAGLFYLFDSEKGKKRRAVARKKAQRLWQTSERAVEKLSPVVQMKAQHLWRTSEQALEGISHDLGARVQDFLRARLRARNEAVHNKAVNGNALIDHVRSEIRHTLSHPDEIRVSTNNGKVRLVGSVPKDELPQLLARVSSVTGVTEMQNRLKVQKPLPKNGHWVMPLIWTVAGSALLMFRSGLGTHR